MKSLFIKMVLDAWYLQIKRTDDLLQSLTDEQLSQEISPGRNTGVYLLGHLAGVHDKMLPLLDLGESFYPELYETFVTSKHDPSKSTPSVHDLRSYWKKINQTLADHFNKMHPDDWFQRHTVISEEDFLKEPHRNKLNLVLNRTNHLEYHRGQMILLKGK
jgi:hypothetical protein